MIICILIPGFIKSYDHLRHLQNIIRQINAEKIYVFGYIFNYMIKPNVNKEKINYNNKNYIDRNKLTIFTSYHFVQGNYEKYDKDGYDNRIISQWHNVKKSFDVYLEFSKKNNVKCDMFIRMRADIHIDKIKKLNEIIKESYVKNKMIFFEPSCHVVNDQLFIGPLVHFSKIIRLSNKIRDYYLLDKIKERIKNHKNNKNKVSFNKYLRFGGESEILLWTHINKNLDKTQYLIKNNDNLFHINRK